MKRIALLQDNVHFDTRNPVPARDNPRASRDYVISIQRTLPVILDGFDRPHPLTINIGYVPDRLICDTKHVDAYFDILTARMWCGIEELANAIADDFSNELIPRWTRVILSLQIDGAIHSAHVEDKQPLWENAALLQRLA